MPRQKFQNSARGVDEQIALTTGRSSWRLSRRFLRSAAAASGRRPAQDGERPMMLVMHDDIQREYAYGPAQDFARHQSRHLHPGSLRRGKEEQIAKFRRPWVCGVLSLRHFGLARWCSLSLHLRHGRLGGDSEDRAIVLGVTPTGSASGAMHLSSVDRSLVAQPASVRRA
jgi:hypothetical protein